MLFRSIETTNPAQRTASIVPLFSPLPPANPRRLHQRRAIPATSGSPRRSAAHPRALLATVLPSLWQNLLLAAASARARPLFAARVSAAFNSGAVCYLIFKKSCVCITILWNHEAGSNDFREHLLCLWITTCDLLEQATEALELLSLMALKKVEYEHQLILHMR